MVKVYYIRCIKQYKDEYGFIYKVGEVYTSTFKSSRGFSMKRPGKGTYGTLAIALLPHDNFIDIQEQRTTILKELLVL